MAENHPGHGVDNAAFHEELGEFNVYLDSHHQDESVISSEPSRNADHGHDDDEHHHGPLPEHYEYHQNKGSQHGMKEPIDLDNGDSVEPGCGCSDEKFCGKCAIFWGDACGCESGDKFKIGLRRVGSRVLMAILLWGYFWSITVAGGGFTLPGGNLFGILMVFLFGIVGETLIVLIPLPFGLPSLPPLLASLFVGIILGNVPGIDFGKDILPDWSFTLRQMALGIILGEAGVEVNKEMMFKLKTVVPRLSFSPCLIEAISYGVFSHLILGLPWLWSFMLGFVCGAVAPACVVPSMIKFQAMGLGVEHGVPTLLMAAASIDDIIAINGFNILLTVTFSTGGIGFNILNAVLEISLGLIFGIVCGILMWYLPDSRQHNIVRDRAFLLVATSWFLIFVTNIIDIPKTGTIPGAGTLGTLTCSFVASLRWPEQQSEAVGHIYKALWYLFQPLLFGLTGANVNLSQMTAHTVGLAVACMIICLTIRLFVAGNAVSFLGWTHKEKFLTSICWIPKATVQAAIGGTSLDETHKLCDNRVWKPLCSDLSSTVVPVMNSTDFNATSITSTTTSYDVTTGATSVSVNSTQPTNCVTEYKYPSPQLCENYFNYATIILQVSVLVIIITAPIGVFLIGLAGPRLLTKYDPDQEGKKENLELGDVDKNSDKGRFSSIRSNKSSVNTVSTMPPAYQNDFYKTQL